MFKAGDRVQLTAIGESKYVKQSGGGEGTVVFDTRLSGRTDVRWDSGHSNNYESVDLMVISATPATLKAPSVKAEERVKYLYSVQDSDGNPILNTRDREYARETKALLGGKKEGIIIMAYAPVKEIR